MTSLGIKPVTFRLVAQCPNQLCCCVPRCTRELKTNDFCVIADGEELQAVVSTPSLTSQLLLLYYLLLYEDVRLANTHSYVQAGRKVKSYSTEFLSELPIKYLLQQAQKDQQSYAGLC
jgi:hypothetical protein